MNEGVLSHLKFSSFYIDINPSILTTWFIMLGLFLVCWVLYRHRSNTPSHFQTTLEAIYVMMHDTIKEVLPSHVDRVFPFIATLWLFILIANLIGIIPGLSSPTADLSVTASLSFLTFLSVHWFGISIQGIKKYLSHYLTPSPLLLPFHIISEFSRTLALAIRLFGNMMSLELTALIVLMVAGFLAPIPILVLHIVEALIQAYIFGMLALIYIASGIQINDNQET